VCCGFEKTVSPGVAAERSWIERRRGSKYLEAAGHVRTCYIASDALRDLQFAIGLSVALNGPQS